MVVSVGGGEPLLHEDLIGIVRALAQHHFPVMICNGWYVTPEKARALFEAGIGEVSISVDYADPTRHDEQRGMPGAFDKAMEALRILQENRVHPWQRVHMISVVMEDNLDELEPLIQRCRAMGITYLVTLYSTRRGHGAPQSPPIDVSARMLDLHRRYPEFVQIRGYLARFTEAFQQDGIGPCYAGKHLCNIDCQGQVSLCIDRLDEPVGNLLTDAPQDIERRLREKYQTNDCRSCWTSCRGTIESLRYGKGKIGSLRDYSRMIRPLPLR
jgi:MoaA/NifB/PqqE/SkfB family radical SAM enzyme